LISYLQSKGILCLADEVQTGFGRSGTHFWAFQSYEEGDWKNPNLRIEFIFLLIRCHSGFCHLG
jgi:hypothetical protein